MPVPTGRKLQSYERTVLDVLIPDPKDDVLKLVEVAESSNMDRGIIKCVVNLILPPKFLNKEGDKAILVSGPAVT
jgi:hypothetical protein